MVDDIITVVAVEHFDTLSIPASTIKSVLRSFVGLALARSGNGAVVRGIGGLSYLL